jgi:hypothetical protein
MDRDERWQNNPPPRQRCTTAGTALACSGDLTAMAK